MAETLDPAAVETVMRVQREHRPAWDRSRCGYVCTCGTFWDGWDVADEHVAREAVAALDLDTRDRAARLDTFAETSAALNCVADIWERDGSDPCRVRVTREYANAYRAYAEGFGNPTGSDR